MFGFNNKVNKEREARKERNALEAQQRKFEKYWKWNHSEEYKRMLHLKTLIIKAYGTVGINVDIFDEVLSYEFTREDYVEDFKVFFRPEVFNKLQEWCKEYEILREKKDEILNQ